MRWRTILRGLISSVLPVLLELVTRELQGIGQRQDDLPPGEKNRRLSDATPATTAAKQSTSIGGQATK